MLAFTGIMQNSIPNVTTAHCCAVLTVAPPLTYIYSQLSVASVFSIIS